MNNLTSGDNSQEFDNIEIPLFWDLLKDAKNYENFINDPFLTKYYTQNYLKLFFDFLNQVSVMNDKDQAKCIEYPVWWDYYDWEIYDGDFASWSKIFDRFLEIFGESIVYQKQESFAKMYFDIKEKFQNDYIKNAKIDLENAMKPEYIHNIYIKLWLSFDEEIDLIEKIVWDDFEYNFMTLDSMIEYLDEEKSESWKSKMKLIFQKDIITPYLLENVVVMNSIIKQKNINQEELEVGHGVSKELTDKYKELTEILNNNDIKLNVDIRNICMYPISNEWEYHRLRNQIIWDISSFSSFSVIKTNNVELIRNTIPDLQQNKNFTVDGKPFDQFAFIEDCWDDLMDKNDEIYNKNEYDDDNSHDDIDSQIQNWNYKIIEDENDWNSDLWDEDIQEKKYDFSTEEEIVIFTKQKLKQYYEMWLYLSMDSEGNPCLQIKLHKFQNKHFSDGGRESSSDIWVVSEEYPFYFEQTVNDNFHEDFMKILERLAVDRDINSLLWIKVSK